MSLSIRTFRNTDAPSICSVWNQHYADQPADFKLDSQLLELFCLGKPYFDGETFWIAEKDGTVVGFLHAGPHSNQAQDEIDSSSLSISAFCVRPHSSDKEVASQLIQTCSHAARKLGAREVFFKPTLPDCPFYLGLGPAHSMAGATKADARACQWLTASGFSPETPTSLWELSLADYAPPIDRTQIQVRRTASVSRQVEEPELSWWIACILGHTEPTSFQLTHRQERRVLAEILYWMLSPELNTTSESIVWLWTPDMLRESGWADQLLFLLAESLREFQSERVDVVRAVTPAHENSLAAILRRLGFSPIENGLVFRQALADI